jgi:hypothetical protein
MIKNTLCGRYGRIVILTRHVRELPCMRGRNRAPEVAKAFDRACDAREVRLRHDTQGFGS